MSSTVTRRLWLNADTDKAIMVSHEFTHYAKSNRWLARSMVTIEATETVRHTKPDGTPGIIVGTLLTLAIPDWLAKREGLNSEPVIPEGAGA